METKSKKKVSMAKKVGFHKKWSGNQVRKVGCREKLVNIIS